MNGTVFDIKEFAIYDGPGVRQTVFMKGCPLRCAWCHNPEGLKGHPELGVSSASCIHCGKCRDVCQKRHWDEHFIRSSDCDLCLKCADVCPMGLRRVYGRIYSEEELAKKILDKADYYRRYGGGVTFSGGEPLFQGEFLCRVLDLLPNVHKAIETSAYAQQELFEKVIKRLDYVIMDIKCISDELHKKYTGVSNELILSNYRLLRKIGIIHTVRIPLISGVSDTNENLERTAELLSGDPFLERAELLPYQKTAGAKYRTLGREYTYEPTAAKGTEDPVKIFEKHGVRCSVL